MQEVSYIIALIGTLVLLASAAVWLKGLRKAQLQPIAGRLQQDASEKAAAIALVAAFAISLVAATLAIGAWMF